MTTTKKEPQRDMMWTEGKEGNRTKDLSVHSFVPSQPYRPRLAVLSERSTTEDAQAEDAEKSCRNSLTVQRSTRLAHGPGAVPTRCSSAAHAPPRMNDHSSYAGAAQRSASAEPAAFMHSCIHTRMHESLPQKWCYTLPLLVRSRVY